MSGAPTLVLLVEDDPSDARLIRELLAEAGAHFAFECVDRLASALKRIDRAGAGRGVDVVLLDLGLPDSRGLDTLVRLQAGAHAAAVVVLTGTDDEAMAAQAMRGGAQDYLVKGQMDGHMMARSIRYALERKRAENALRENEDMLVEAQRVAKLGYYVLDIKMGCWTSSAELDNIFGIHENYKRDVDGWLQLVHPAFRETMAGYFQDHVLKRHNKFDKEYKIVDPDTGRVKWVHGLGRLRFDDNGNPVEMFGTIQDITERKEAEQQLKDSEAQFRAVAESAGEAIITTTVDGKVTFWNRAATEVFGYTAEEIVGQPLTVLMPERYHARHRAGIARLAATGEARVTGEVAELEGLRKDGSEFPLTLSCGMWSSHGEPQFSAIIHDMTERIEAEDLVERLSRRNELILTSAGEGIFGVDREGRTTFVNPTAARWLGRSASEMLGMPIHSMICSSSPDGGPSPTEECEVLGVKRGGESRRGETTFRRADGTSLPVRYVSTPLVDAGEIMGTVVLFEDVTQRKVAEAALSEAHNIINLSPAVAFLWKNEEGWPVEYVSSNVKELFGYTAEEFMAGNVPYTSVIHADDLETALERNSTYSKERERNDFTQEYRIVTKAGQTKWTDDRTRIRRNDKGDITHYQGIVLDITERRRAEESLRELNISLERRVAERTAELEAANRELESFSYSVSHDLKAPLRAIDGYSGKLAAELDERSNAEARRLIDVVRQRAQHMGRLIDDLLTFSRLGRATLTCIDVDMRKLARTTFAELAAMSAGRKMELAVGDLPTVHADPNLIRQVWVNLLDNAIKFTGKREAARIEVGYREDADGHVFSVRDNGAGFDMEYVDKLFGVFQRLHYEDEFPGTGVGLATVRRIVERHGGDAWADGEVDHGATICFRLPRTEPVRHRHGAGKSGPK